MTRCEPCLCRKSAERWATRSSFSSEQMTEFGHLMGMVCSTYISKGKLKSMKEIDSGSFGKIYASSYDGVPVAVKQISNKPGDSTIKSKMRELLLELRVLVRVRHPNVVTFWGTATEFPAAENPHSQPYIGLVFELCEKKSLNHALFESQTKLKPSQKLKVAHQTALGLAYLHSKRVIHRDINPRNILLTADMTAKIADFGCARVLSGSATSLKTTTISGSPAYMAPEQLLGQDLTEAVDTWAFGIMLWEIMKEQKPWEGRFNDFHHLKMAILNGETLPLPQDARPFPQCYVNMIKLGMQYNQQDRPSMTYIEGELGSAIVQFKNNLKRERDSALMHQMEGAC
jgi:serine/threonine protein kinase